MSQLPQIVELKAQKGETKKSAGEGAVMVDDLKGAVEGKVCTRFPPEPSGFLHIGHAKAAFLNDFYAKKYKGRLILRFDDTNPVKEKEEYEEAIKKDLVTMGITFAQTSYTSDHFDYILDRAEAMIDAGLAFCDSTGADEMSAQREQMIPSPFRDSSREETKKHWEEMKKGSEIGAKFALRAKIDYKHENGTLRDPVIYRVVPVAHARTGDKFKVYPIYNFACPIVDSVEGVTHALRSNEYHSSEAQYYWFLENIPDLKNRNVLIKDFSRLNFKYTVLSKRKLQWFVDNGHVDSWSDPRFPTIQGVVRRGLTIEALRSFIMGQGDTTKITNMDMSKLWAMNRTKIDREIPRFFAIESENAVTVTVTGAPTTPQEAEVFKCRANEALGKKKIHHFHQILLAQVDAAILKEGEELTLMEWGNAIVKTITKEGDKVKHIEMDLHLAGDFKTTANKFQWVSTTPAPATVTLVSYDHLITVPNLPKEGELKDFVRSPSKSSKQALADPNVLHLAVGDKFQFERVGYFIVDSVTGGDFSFVEIPTGHTKTVFAK